MGFFDSIKVFADTVKTTVSVGMDMYEQGEKIEAVFKTLDDYRDDLTEVQADLLDEWLAAKETKEEAQGHEKKEAESQQDAAALSLIENILREENLPEEVLAPCREVLTAQKNAEEGIAELFNKHTDDEKVKAKVREATHKVMGGKELDFDDEDDYEDDEDEDAD